MCECGTSKKVMVRIPAYLSHTKQPQWSNTKIDSCIADIVDALQKGGIDMCASCCGHHSHRKSFGDIHLKDGRILLIDHLGEWDGHRVKLFLRSAWTSFIHPKYIRTRIAWRNSLWRIKNLRWKPNV